MRPAAGIAVGILCALAVLCALAGPAHARGVYRVDGTHVQSPIGPNDKLKYYGGRVISNVEIVEVSWTSAVNAAYMTQLQSFYQAIVKSAFIDWLVEYDSIGKTGYADNLPGTNQHIGRGTFGGAFVITPGNTKTALDDTEIQAELIAQLMAAKLPPPKKDSAGNVNTLYMLDFPPGYSITLVGIHSCSNFGAYHFTLTYNGDSIPYGIHPGCGYSFDTSTTIHSHELTEAITDMEVGLVETNAFNLSARPLAWVTLAATAWDSLENADLCQSGPGDTVAGYKVTKVWSNYAQGCVAQIPICDGILQPPACRPCTTYDSGNACSGAKPACATAGPQAGRCVPCTTAYPNSCMPPTPVCDDASYLCVGCVKDTDCNGNTPFCDKKSKTCRGCTSDEECFPRACDMENDGQKGQCIECRFDADCGPGKKCDMHVCVDLPDSGVPSPDGGVGNMPADAGCGCNQARTSDGWFWALLGTIAIAARRKRT